MGAWKRAQRALSAHLQEVGCVSDTTDKVLRGFGTLSPKQQRAFFAALAKSKDERPSQHREWRLWRVWYVDQAKPDGKDYMLMYARDAGEAKEFSNAVRHTTLIVVAIEEIP